MRSISRVRIIGQLPEIQDPHRSQLSVPKAAFVATVFAWWLSALVSSFPSLQSSKSPEKPHGRPMEGSTEGSLKPGLGGKVVAPLKTLVCVRKAFPPPEVSSGGKKVLRGNFPLRITEFRGIWHNPLGLSLQWN